MELKIDYLTVNFDANTVTLDDICKTLASEDLFFRPKTARENALLVSPFGMSYLNDSGYAPRPHRLQISGVGCRKFEPTIPMLSQLTQKNGGELAISRIDFAFDYPVDKSLWKEYVKKAFCASLDSDRKIKKYTIAGSGEDMTVYIGSRLSDAYFRIYNKTLESKGKYVYTVDGQPVDISEDQYVIRFEVELKRHVHHLRGECTIFDPTPLFYQYFSNDKELLTYIKSLWLEYGDENVLFSNFENEELRYSSKNLYFASISYEAAINIVLDKLLDEPRTFSHTLPYIVSHFGKYIPFIVSDYSLLEMCQQLCKSYCGFIPDYPIDLMIKPVFEEIEELDPGCPFQYTLLPEGVT